MAAPPPGARCAKHADAAAVDLCQRCGSFVCSECIEIRNEEVYCAACAAILDRPPSKRIRAVFWISGAWLLVMLGALVLAALRGLSLVFLGVVVATPVLAAVMAGLWIAELLAQRRGAAPMSGRARLRWSAAFIGVETVVTVGLLAALAYFIVNRTPA